MHIVLNKVLTGIAVWQMSDVTLFVNSLIYRIGYEVMVLCIILPPRFMEQEGIEDGHICWWKNSFLVHFHVLLAIP
jgi:hypothetical protein